MKTMRNTLVVLLTVISTSAFAAGEGNFVDSLDFQANVLPSLQSKSFRLIYTSEEQQPVHIKLKDANGQLQFSQRYQLTEFVQPFDLTQLPDGDYTFEVWSGQQKSVFPISNELKAAELPVFELDINAENRVARLETEAPMGVSMRLLIYDQEGELLHKEYWVAGQKINRQYDMQQVRTNGVTFLLLDGNEVINERSIEF
ncbi:MAG: hypothetical protein AAGC88_01355 [Bacteroidota bacterium]